MCNAKRGEGGLKHSSTLFKTSSNRLQRDLKIKLLFISISTRHTLGFSHCIEHTERYTTCNLKHTHTTPSYKIKEKCWRIENLFQQKMRIRENNGIERAHVGRA